MSDTTKPITKVAAWARELESNKAAQHTTSPTIVMLWLHDLALAILQDEGIDLRLDSPESETQA